MKYLLLLVLLFVSLSTFGSTTHHIFLIHGIGSDETTFGSMKEVLKSDLGKIELNQVGQSYNIHNITYNTGSTYEHAANFAKDLDVIKKIVKKRDTFSIVAHSQGGLIVAYWVMKEKGKKILTQMDSLITLGTPYGGSKLAYIAKSASNPLASQDQYEYITNHLKEISPWYLDLILNMGKLLYKNSSEEKILKENSLVMNSGVNSVVLRNILRAFKLGDRELEEMSIVSQSSVALRRQMIDGFYKDIRMLSISGLLPTESSEKYDMLSIALRGPVKKAVKKLRVKGFGGENFEADIAVSVPSSRFEFIFGKDSMSPQGYLKAPKKYDVFESSGYANSNLNAKHIISEGVHFGFGALPSLVRIPIDCHPELRKMKEKINLILKKFSFSKKKKLKRLLEILPEEMAKKVYFSKVKPSSNKAVNPLMECHTENYQYVLQHILGCEAGRDTCSQMNSNQAYLAAMKDLNREKEEGKREINLKGFVLDISLNLKSTKISPHQMLSHPLIKNLHLGDDQVVSPRVFRYLQFPFLEQDNSLDHYLDHELPFQGVIGGSIVPKNNKKAKIKLGKKEEVIGSAGEFYKSGKDGRFFNSFHFFISGEVMDKRIENLHGEEYEIEFRVAVPGFKPRLIKTKVRPTYTTYLDVDLIPENEFKVETKMDY